MMNKDDLLLRGAFWICLVAAVYYFSIGVGIL
jgi:hypothetical protein